MAAAIFAYAQQPVVPASLAYPGTKHLGNIRQLTFGGQNAEFSSDGKRLVWVSNSNGQPHETNIFFADWVE